MCKYIKDYNEWGKFFPHLFENFKKEEVYAYDSVGVTHELTELNKSTIKRLEEEGKEYNLKVIAVINGTYTMEGEPIRMSSYIVIDDDGSIVPINDDNDKYLGVSSVLAYVDNTSWDIQEYGYISITEKAGLLFRIG